MSDSELSDAPSTTIPPDAELKDSLRNEVRKALKTGGDVTVRNVRDASVKALGLPEGFYTSEKWKTTSKEIIHAEHDRLQTEREHSSQSVPKAQPSKKAPVHVPKRTAKQAPSATASPPNKKRKSNAVDNDTSDLSSEPSDIEYDTEEEKPQKVTKSASKTTEKTKHPSTARVISKGRAQSDASEKEDEVDTDKVGDAAGSDSEMSVVLDDEPVKKRRSKSKDTTMPRASKSKKDKTKPSVEDDPDKEEIKKLQGWLVKCGVRKVWGKELKPHETSKAKIKHLKGMLTDVGMTGRYSNDKAAQIKEARELAADIEAVQEGAQRWGKDEDSADDGENRTRGGRRIVRGSKNYDFLSSDGEETD